MADPFSGASSQERAPCQVATVVREGFRAMDEPSRFGIVTVVMHAGGVGLEGEWEEGRPDEHGGTGWCPLKPR